MIVKHQSVNLLIITLSNQLINSVSEATGREAVCLVAVAAHAAVATAEVQAAAVV